MKAIKEEVITKYAAIDGTEFKSKEECEKYEETAMCVINARFNELNPVVRECAGDDFYICSCDVTAHSVFIHDDAELDKLNMFLQSHNASLAPSDCNRQCYSKA